MKKSVNLIVSFMVIIAFIGLVACGGGGAKVKLTPKGELLTSITWKLDPSATLKGTTDAIKDSTSIIADIKLEKDVKAFADFLAETVQFGIDENDQSKLSYSRTIGEGFLSSQTVGYWSFNADESAVIMRDWDSQANKEKEPVTYKIVELTKDKLVLQKEGDAAPNIYLPKK
jgi:hypothetical protein